MELIVFGMNHRTAPVDLRERWAFSGERSRQALRGLREKVSGAEHLILSTCNRTEIYSHLPRSISPLPEGLNPPPLWGRQQSDGNEVDLEVSPTPPEHQNAAQGALRFYGDLFEESQVGDDEWSTQWHVGTPPEHFYMYRQECAIEHLFRLAGGLDSMILGETQILRQIKDAFSIAQEARTVGRFFHRLIPAALRVGKRVRSVTRISHGCITPGQAALKLATYSLDSLAGKRVLVVGSGKIAELSAEALRDAGVSSFRVVNRTPRRARELVLRIGTGETALWNDLRASLCWADVVISSTSSVAPIIDLREVKGLVERRGGRPLAVIDLAIPRDFPPPAGELPGISLYNIDALNCVIQENVADRHAQIPHAEAIIAEELDTFRGHMAYLQVDPVLKHLVARFEQIRLGELQKHISLFPPEYHDRLHLLTDSLVKKLLHFPIEKLKALRDMKDLTDHEVSFLRRMFLTDTTVADASRDASKGRRRWRE